MEPLAEPMDNPCCVCVISVHLSPWVCVYYRKPNSEMRDEGKEEIGTHTSYSVY